MKRRNFIQKSVVATTAMTAGIASVASSATKDKDPVKEFYELRVYELRWSQASLDSYFSKALIPAFNRAGVKKVGVFTDMGKSEPGKLYLFIPYPSFEDYIKINDQLKKDSEFTQASQAYREIPADQAAYARFESSFMIAFDGLPKMVAPQSSNRIFELRTYEGYSEDAVRRKIKMFNDDEFPIFYRTKLNPVFFGEVIAGKGLPCLTYMIVFNSMEERDANWSAFGADPDWKRISSLPEYDNTVSRIYKNFLLPVSYSQI